jgi:hypothetical protein
MCNSELKSVEISDSALITYSYEWYMQMVHKSNYPIHTPSIVTPLNA